MKKILLCFSLIVCIPFFSQVKVAQAKAAQAKTLNQREEVQQFIHEMVSEHGMDKNYLNKVFKQTEIRQDIIDLMNRPAEKVKPWYDYKKIFLTDSRTTKGVNFWQENKEALAYAKQIYGVPEEYIVAIIGVETFYGRITGRHRVIDALATLAFDYPKRAKFFRSELKHYLILTQEEKVDPLSLKGSYAGAMGLGQFMPSSYRNYAVNFDGEGQKDIWTNPTDAIGSVAHYFKRHGWVRDGLVIKAAVAKGRPKETNRKLKAKTSLAEFAERGISLKNTNLDPQTKAALVVLEEQSGPTYWLGFNNFYVISRYNHSAMYSMAVHLLAQDLRRAYLLKNDDKR